MNSMLSIPPLQRCRGVPLGTGNFTGCAYGTGEIRALTGPMDCPTCNGSGYEGVTATWLPHQNFGDPDCSGFLFGITSDDMGYIGCNDCDGVVRVLPASKLQGALDEMELSMESCTEICPHCGKVNLFVGFSTMLIYTCRECGEPVKLGPDPPSLHPGK